MQWIGKELQRVGETELVAAPEKRAFFMEQRQYLESMLNTSYNEEDFVTFDTFIPPRLVGGRKHVMALTPLRIPKKLLNYSEKYGNVDIAQCF